ncbi:MAG: DUF5053 domain-containing protein [Prevotella sp.]|jgi:hypothetical protein|nr:DUF5053 domain-containing protein [Prevotella sp.]
MSHRDVIYEELELLRNCKTDEERKRVKAQLIEKHKDDSEDDAMQSLAAIKDEVDTVGIEINLLELSKCGISLTYIAEEWLGKSRAYLSQRIHHNLVNGKAVYLLPEEKEKIRNGLLEMSKKLQNLSVLLAG